MPGAITLPVGQTVPVNAYILPQKMTRQFKKPERRRGQIIPKGDGQYLIRFYVRRHADGRRRYSSKLVRGSYKKADQELTKALRELDTGTFVEPSRQTLVEYMTTWLDTVARLTISERSLDDYRTRLARDVFPVLGQQRLDRLSLGEIQELYSKLSSRGLSPRTIRYTHSILKQGLEKAVIAGLLMRNPAQHAVLPRQRRREMSVLTTQQVNRFLVVTDSSTLHALWTILLLGGLRPAEALALRWSDLEGNKLQIVRSLKKCHGDRYSIAEPKTEGSRRPVLLPDRALRALREHRTRQATEILAAGATYERNDLMFANCAGRPMDLSKVRRLFKKALKDAGLPMVRLYDCRHSHATLLLSAGENPKIVSERLGHTTVSMTLDTYSHVLPDMQQATVERIDRILAAATG